MATQGEISSTAAPAPSGGRQWSITSRLTLLYTLSAFGILFLALAFLYWEVATDLQAQEDQFLVDEISTLRVIISEHPKESEQLRTEVEVESTARPFTKYYARIMDESGHVLMQTRGMDEMFPSPNTFPTALRVSDVLRRGTRRKATDGRTYVCTAARAQVGSSRSNRWVIQLALEGTQQEEDRKSTRLN